MTGKFLVAHFTDSELAPIKAIAERDGVTIEQAAARLASEELAARIKSRTGKAPAKVYEMPTKRTEK